MPTIIPLTTGSYVFEVDDVPTPVTSGGFVFQVNIPDVAPINCDCTDENDALTLAQMRVEMMNLLGFAAQASNPPPGMTALLTSFIQRSYAFLYKRYPALRTRRFFRWSTMEGVRYYGMRDNDEDIICDLHLDPYKEIEGVWLVDANGVWFPMSAGIPPVWYTTVAQTGIPIRYEIRQCLEIFPAPNSNDYKVMIKGHFGKPALVADDDQPAIDGDLLLEWSLARAKAHYAQPDANAVVAQANTMLKDLVAGTHITKRYVPGAIKLPPAVMPLFLPLNGAPP